MLIVLLVLRLQAGLPLTMLTLSDDYELRIRQGPERARVAGVKEKGKSSFAQGPATGR